MTDFGIRGDEPSVYATSELVIIKGGTVDKNKSATRSTNSIYRSHTRRLKLVPHP
jgi:hypothetical protein